MQEDDQPVAGINYTKVTDYTTFDAEYALVGSDIVIHLFQPFDKKHPPRFWQDRVATILDRFAQQFWRAQYPRLKAAYTEELDSWWLRACGFADQGDPEARIHKFLMGLDDEVEKARVPGGYQGQ